MRPNSQNSRVVVTFLDQYFVVRDFEVSMKQCYQAPVAFLLLRLGRTGNLARHFERDGCAGGRCILGTQFCGEQCECDGEGESLFPNGGRRSARVFAECKFCEQVVDGETPLMRLPDDDARAVKVVELLLEFAADASIPDPGGRTTAYLASGRGLDDAAFLLNGRS